MSLSCSLSIVVNQIHIKTRMHSSRRRTSRSLTVSGGLPNRPPWANTPLGRHSPLGDTPLGRHSPLGRHPPRIDTRRQTPLGRHPREDTPQTDTPGPGAYFATSLRPVINAKTAACHRSFVKGERPQFISVAMHWTFIALNEKSDIYMSGRKPGHIQT